MPSSPRSKPRSAAPRSPGRAARPVAPPPAPVERERFDSLRDDFDEAALHVGQRREFTGFRIGPVLDVPLGLLTPGTVGWRRRVDWGRADATPVPDRDPDAWLYLLVVPTIASDDEQPILTGPDAGPLLQGPCDTNPPTVLVAQPRSEVGAPLLERFRDALCTELESGD